MQSSPPPGVTWGCAFSEPGGLPFTSLSMGSGEGAASSTSVELSCRLPWVDVGLPATAWGLHCGWLMSVKVAQQPLLGHVGFSHW